MARAKNNNISFDNYVTRQWLAQLVAFPLEKLDDAEDATATGLERLAGLSDNEAVASTEFLTKMNWKLRLLVVACS